MNIVSLWFVSPVVHHNINILVLFRRERVQNSDLIHIFHFSSAFLLLEVAEELLP